MRLYFRQKNGQSESLIDLVDSCVALNNYSENLELLNLSVESDLVNEWKFKAFNRFILAQVIKYEYEFSLHAVVMRWPQISYVGLIRFRNLLIPIRNKEIHIVSQFWITLCRHQPPFYGYRAILWKFNTQVLVVDHFFLRIRLI